MEEIKINNGYNLPVGVILGCGIGGVVMGAGIMSCSKAYIPQTNIVESGYIAPSRLEIKCKDLDGNGQPETIMKIGDKALIYCEKLTANQYFQLMKSNLLKLFQNNSLILF